MPISRKALCIAYGLIALVGTWGNVASCAYTAVALLRAA